MENNLELKILNSTEQMNGEDHMKLFIKNSNNIIVTATDKINTEGQSDDKKNITTIPTPLESVPDRDTILETVPTPLESVPEGDLSHFSALSNETNTATEPLHRVNVKKYADYSDFNNKNENNNHNNNNFNNIKKNRENLSTNRNRGDCITTMITSLNISSSYNVFIAVFAVNLSALAAGCILTWSSPTLPKIQEPGGWIFVTKEEGAWLGSLVALGASLGPFVSSAIVDRIGRKWTILLVMLLFLISWATIGITVDVRIMYLARFLAGIGVGCIFSALPMYVAEVSPVSLRGALGSLMQFFLCSGFLISYSVGPYTSFLTLVLVSACLPLLCILIFVWIPESPYYLINKGRKQEAYNSLQWMRGFPGKLVIQNEIAEMQMAAEESSKEKASIINLVNNKGNLKALYYALMLVFFQQLSGVNVVLFYGEDIFHATGSSLSPSISTIIIGLLMLASAACTAPGAKFIGIKNLLIFSSIGSIISTGALAFYFYVKDSKSDLSSTLGWLPITSLIVFIATFSIGFGPFVWVIVAEIFPSHLKAIASALAASFCWFLAFILTKFYSTVTEYVGNSYAFLAFSLCSVFSLLFLLCQLPDTQNKTFCEIQEMLQGKKINHNNIQNEKV